MAELLDAVKGSPFLLAFLVIIGAVVFLVEKLAGVNGPLTRAWAAWQNRELNRLRREALLRAERRKIAVQEESDTMQRLQGEVAWLHRERDDQRRRDRVRDQHDRELADYVWRLLQAARTAGIVFIDPPERPQLAPLFVSGDEDDDPPNTEPLPISRNPARGRLTPG